MSVSVYTTIPHMCLPFSFSFDLWREKRPGTPAANELFAADHKTDCVSKKERHRILKRFTFTSPPDHKVKILAIRVSGDRYTRFVWLKGC